ncbi:globin [uncultured Brevibacillus sp.]|uniref:globin domain-containing protein n=1 Tax=uncultured Brevibacillus sp. TaxID=169970 RepID=UPI002594D0AA|nr:globin [uncultured Brevibacillus sp.]
MDIKQLTLFDRIGGTPVIDRLVDLFYMNVLADPKLAPLFPQDMSLVISKQKQFLTQYFGGPPLYTNEHGHPKMRARHLPFPVTKERADAWLACMQKALEETTPEAALREELMSRLSTTAYFFINKEE